MLRTIGRMKMTMMNGVMMMNDITLKELYELQRQNQVSMLKRGMYEDDVDACELPTDNVKLSSYHIQQLMSEIGEVLEADKRWKSFRNGKYDREAKKEEIADCFIVLMNIAMYSGIGAEELASVIKTKIDVVSLRVNES